MKKSFFIFNALLLTLSTMPLFAETITVSGTVKTTECPGEKENPCPLAGAEIIILTPDKTETNRVAVTGEQGNFTISNVSKNGFIKIKDISHKEKIIPALNVSGIIVMEPEAKNMEEVDINITIQDGTTCSFKGGSPDSLVKSFHYQHDANNKLVCVPKECIDDYKLEGTKCVRTECSAAEKKAIKHGTEFKYINGQCIVKKCADGFELNGKANICEECKKGEKFIDGRCKSTKCEKDDEDWDDAKNQCVKDRCTQDELNAIHTSQEHAKWDASQKKCIATKCLDEKNFKLDNDSCIANDCPAKELEKLNATAGTMQNGSCIPSACIDNYKPENGACVNSEILAKKQKDYDEAKAKEQSTANRMLGGLTTAATGIGGMQLAQGLAEKSADKDAEADMAAYIATMRCSYADGKSVKFGTEEIELPGANNAELMKLRNEYFALASDLKERKTALGMKSGIESEEILDRATSDLYDDEFVGIDGGNYASLYRAQALNSETDQKKIADDKKKSKNRVIAGGVLAGAGVVGGIVGNSAINGKLHDKIQERKNKAEKNMEELCSMGGCEAESIKKMDDSQIKKAIEKLADMKKSQQTDSGNVTDFVKGLSQGIKK